MLACLQLNPKQLLRPEGLQSTGLGRGFSLGTPPRLERRAAMIRSYVRLESQRKVAGNPGKGQDKEGRGEWVGPGKYF